ncbi:hypothetical protein Hanom_Chr15g01367111 [Helianthus anomalus]
MTMYISVHDYKSTSDVYWFLENTSGPKVKCQPNYMILVCVLHTSYNYIMDKAWALDDYWAHFLV